MTLRDRIVGLERVSAATLRPHPGNPRRHPEPQRAALRGLLSEIGFADAILAYRAADGALTIIDGHLRAEEAGMAAVPVLVVDVTPAEADKMLATLDPLAAMAETDADAMTALLAGLTAQDDAVVAMLAALAAESAIPAEMIAPAESVAPQLGGMEYRVVVDCADEGAQAALLERLTREGLTCRPLIS